MEITIITSKPFGLALNFTPVGYCGGCQYLLCKIDDLTKAQGA